MLESLSGDHDQDHAALSFELFNNAWVSPWGSADLENDAVVSTLLCSTLCPLG